MARPTRPTTATERPDYSGIARDSLDDERELAPLAGLHVYAADAAVTRPQLGAFALSMIAAAGCAIAQPRDAAWARRQIIESECRTWAQSQARAEYAPQIQNAARQQSSFVRSGNSAGAGLAGSTVALAQLAQQGREKELFDACLIEREAK